MTINGHIKKLEDQKQKKSHKDNLAESTINPSPKFITSVLYCMCCVFGFEVVCSTCIGEYLNVWFDF
jgi:hypothetical protein